MILFAGWAGYLSVLLIHTAFMVIGPVFVATQLPPLTDPVPEHPVFPLLGVLTTVCGAVLYVRSHWDLARAGQGTPAVWEPPRFLVLGGPYRAMRNPMYAAVVLIVAGEAALWRNPALLAYAAALFGVFHAFAVLAEEPALIRKFGASYASYREATPRWLPRRKPVSGAKSRSKQLHDGAA